MVKTMSNTIRKTLLIWAVALLVGLPGRLDAQPANNPRASVADIVLGAETVPHASPVWVAERNGYFREEGVTVQILDFSSGRTALFAMLDKGRIDLVTVAQTPVIKRSFGRNDFAIIACMAQSDKDLKVLARTDRAIHSPRDLAGKTVGITSGSSGHYFLDLFLAYHWLGLAHVAIRDMEATDLSGALINGLVDAVATWEPHIYRARKALGNRAVLLPGNIYREDFYFVVRKNLIAEKAQALTRFLRAIERAQQFIRANRAETLTIVERRLKLDRDILEATWDELHFALTLDQDILVSLEDEARWAMAKKLTDAGQIPNYLEFLYLDALEAVKPEAVTIVGRGARP